MRHLAPRTLVAVSLLFGLLAACSTDTPTAPERTPAPPPGSGDPSTAWNITVTSNVSSLTASSAQPATITIQVRRADNGQPPPTGTTVIASAGLGEFNSAGSGAQAIVVTLNSAGAAQLLYFAGAILGTDTVQAQLESSVGQTLIDIVEAAVLFITGVTPNSGPQGGGTRLRIEGTAFEEPLRVTVGGIQASIDRVANDGSFIRAVTGAVIDPDSFFDTEACDENGDGVSGDGERYLATTVDLVVALASGGSATLPDAFTYLPANGGCRDVTPDPDRPRADFTFVVNGLTVLFSNRSTPDSGLTFTWVFGDGTATSAAKDPVHTYAFAGTYQVTLRAVNASGSSTRSKMVTVP